MPRIRKSGKKDRSKQERRERVLVNLHESLSSGLLRRLLGENLRKHWRLYGLGMGAMVIAAVTTAGTAWMVQYVIDVMAQPDVGYTAAQVALGVLLLFTVRGLASYVQVVTMTRAGTAVVADQQSRVYETILHQGVSFFSAWGSSSLLVRVTNGANAARNVIDILVTTFVRDLLTVVALLVVMVVQQPVLTLAALVVGPLVVLVLRRLLWRIRNATNTELAGQSEITRVVQETTLGIQVIKVFGLERPMQRRMNRAIADVRRRRNLIARLLGL